MNRSDKKNNTKQIRLHGGLCGHWELADQWVGYKNDLLHIDEKKTGTLNNHRNILMRNSFNCTNCDIIIDH